MRKKGFILLAAFLMLAGAYAGGTLAYLADGSGSSSHTFAIGNVEIALTENTEGADMEGEAGGLHMVPGNTVKKDLAVSVAEGSEDCWLFVKLEKSDNLDAFIRYELEEGWRELPSESGVYYRSVYVGDREKTFSVLKDNQMVIREDITKRQMDEVSQGKTNAPALSFTAYAVQKANIGTVQEAWKQIGS